MDEFNIKDPEWENAKRQALLVIGSICLFAAIYFIIKFFKG